MSLTDFLLSVALLWVVIYAAHASFQKSSRLPSLQLSGRRFRAPWVAASQVSLRDLRLHISTSALNESHDKLSGYLLRTQNHKILVALKVLYNAGIVASVCGMLVGCGGLAWVITSSFLRPSSTTGGNPPNVFRRDSTRLDPASQTRSPLAVTLIIPGVTVPISDLPFIMISVFVSQLLHEFGHAVAAALDAIPILACGASLTVVIPAAFVSLSTPLYRGLGTVAKARIVSAGPFHNLAMWGCLTFVRAAGLNQLFTSIFYRDISDSGRIIVNVDQASPLAGYLVPGITLLKQLDDSSLATRLDVWSTYLEAQPKPLAKGWCVPEANFKEPSLCCSTGPGALSTAMCFLSITSPVTSVGCTDPVSILTNTSARRCGSTSDCYSNELCGAPETTGLIRLTAQQGQEEFDQVLLWSGPRHEIREQVAVGIWKPRLRFLTVRVLEACSRLWRYLEMAALSLYLLNLLPLPFLDGRELLRALRQGQFRDIEGQG